MRRNPSIRPLFGTLIVLALGYYDWTLYQRLMGLRALESGEVERQRVNARIAAANHEADQWEAKADALAQRGAPGAAGKTAAGSANAADAVAATQKLADEVRNQLIAEWIDRVYGPFFKTLSLNPAELERFKGLIAEKRQAILDALDATRGQGVTDPADIRDAILDAIKQPNSDAQSLLGNADYNRFREYQQGLPARSTVDDLAASLPPGVTLTDQQTEALIKIIAQGQAPSTRAVSIMENLLTNVSAPVNAQDLSAAGAVLNTAQLNALKGLQVQQLAQRDLLRLLYP